MYKQEVTAWQKQDGAEVFNKAAQIFEKKSKENSLVIYGINQGDDPQKIVSFLRKAINELINDKKLVYKSMMKQKAEVWDELKSIQDQS